MKSPDYTRYIVGNLGRVIHPFNGADAFVFSDLPALCRLLDLLLTLPSASGLRDTIATAIAQHLHLPYQDTVARLIALRSLVASVEPFLKAIGELRHAGNESALDSLAKAMLKGVLERGLVLPPTTWDSAQSGRSHVHSYWQTQDFSTAALYRVWQLRNDLAHESPDVAPADLPQLFDITIAVLLLAVRHPPNRGAIEFTCSPFLKHLHWLRTHFTADITGFVPLYARLHWSPSSEDLSYAVGMGAIAPLPVGPEQPSLLLRQIPRLILVGTGGAGKSRVIRQIAAQSAVDTLLDRTTIRDIPLCVPAYALAAQNTTIRQLQPFLQDVAEEQLADGLNAGLFTILIDGLNEVAPSSYRQVIQAIQSLTTTFPKCRLIVTTRVEHYRNELGFPSYELEPLTADGIHEILHQRSASPQLGDALFARIQRDGRLIALFRTPLTARLLSELAGEDTIPRDIGRLLATIFHKVFEREHSKGDRTSTTLATKGLVAIAEQCDHASGKALSESDVLDCLHEAVARLAPEVSCDRLLSS